MDVREILAMQWAEHAQPSRTYTCEMARFHVRVGSGAARILGVGAAVTPALKRHGDVLERAFNEYCATYDAGHVALGARKVCCDAHRTVYAADAHTPMQARVVETARLMAENRGFLASQREILETMARDEARIKRALASIAPHISRETRKYWYLKVVLMSFIMMRHAVKALWRRTTFAEALAVMMGSRTVLREPLTASEIDPLRRTCYGLWTRALRCQNESNGMLLYSVMRCISHGFLTDTDMEAAPRSRASARDIAFLASFKRRHRMRRS